MDKVENVIIIGGGPAGLAAAVYTARATLSPLLFGGSPYGGQLMLTSDVENYPGFESILGPSLIEKMREHVKRFGTRIIDENILNIDFSKKPFELTSSSALFKTKSVIITTGAKALWLGLESETKLRGKGVSACATCDGFFFKDKVVGVVGGGDTAMEEALTLTRFASKVYVMHRRDSFRASKIMQERVLKHPKIEVMWNTTVKEVIGDQHVSGVTLSNGTNLPLNGLFIAIGHKPDTDLFKGKIALDNKGYIITSERFAKEFAKIKSKAFADEQTKLRTENPKVPPTLKEINYDEMQAMFDLSYNHQTSVSGVFAAGDAVDFVYRQAGTAAGQGIAAALEVEKYLSE